MANALGDFGDDAVAFDMPGQRCDLEEEGSPGMSSRSTLGTLNPTIIRSAARLWMMGLRRGVGRLEK